MATFKGVRPSLVEKGLWVIEESRIRASQKFVLNEGYRDYDEQVRIFLDRYTTTVLPGRPSTTWEGKRWFLKPGFALAAAPGTSRHGHRDKDGNPDGLALDIGCLARDAPVRAALFMEAGLVRTVPGEGWHVEEKNGIALPKATKKNGIDMASTKYIIEPCPTGGYWALKRSDGGIGSYGDAPFFDSMPGVKAKVVAPLVGLTPCVKDGVVIGYWVYDEAGHVYSFGKAPHYDGYAEYKEWQSPNRKIVGLVQTAGQFGPRTVVRYSLIGEETNDEDYVVDTYDLGPEYNKKR